MENKLCLDGEARGEEEGGGIEPSNESGVSEYNIRPEGWRFSEWSTPDDSLGKTRTGQTMP